MQQKTIEYGVGGKVFRSQLFLDGQRQGRRPGVLVFPEAFGLDAHALQRAQRLAQLGYAVLAVDPHGDAHCYADIASASPAIRALYGDRAQWRARASAALNALMTDPAVDVDRLAAIGFCFGGSTCLELIRSGAPLQAMVAFHAGLLPQQMGDVIRPGVRVLICQGANDPLVKPEILDAVTGELQRAQAAVQIIRYDGAQHSFTNPDADRRGMPGFAYHAEADQRSWQAMQTWLEEAFR